MPDCIILDKYLNMTKLFQVDNDNFQNHKRYNLVLRYQARTYQFHIQHNSFYRYPKCTDELQDLLHLL